MSFAAAMGVIQGAGQIYAGYSAYSSAKKQASLLKQQGEIALKESLRNAALIIDDGKRFQQQQEMAYISSGVDIEGTPLLLMTETKYMAGAEAKAMEESGYAQKKLYDQQAKIAKKEGKSQFISSIFGGTASGLGGFK
jgi:hypothetical protein